MVLEPDDDDEEDTPRVKHTNRVFPRRDYNASVRAQSLRNRYVLDYTTRAVLKNIENRALAETTKHWYYY